MTHIKADYIKEVLNTLVPHFGLRTLSKIGPESFRGHPVLRSDMHSTETRKQLTTENSTTLIKAGPSFGMQVERDVRLQANRTRGIGLQITL